MKTKKIIIHYKEEENTGTLNAINEEFERLETFSHYWRLSEESFPDIIYLDSVANTDYFIRLAGIMKASKEIAYITVGYKGNSFEIRILHNKTLEDFLENLKTIDHIEVD